MNFLITPFLAAVGAAGAIARLPLSAASGLAFSRPELRTGRTLPSALAATAPQAGRPHLGQPGQQARHRAQCRAFCRSKAGF